MGQVAVDVVVAVRYDTKEPSNTRIYTNAREEVLDEILSAWVQDQIGRGKDSSPPNMKDVYTIKIGLVLEDDSFCTESDTGNKGLTAGIVMDVLGKLETIPVKELSELPKGTGQLPLPV